MDAISILHCNILKKTIGFYIYVTDLPFYFREFLSIYVDLSLQISS